MQYIMRSVASGSAIPADTLFLQAKFFGKRGVRAFVVLLEIFQMLTTIRDHVQKTPPRMDILLVFAQMRSKLVDFF